MAKNPKVSFFTANAMANVAGPEANNGVLAVYDGSQPATPETSATGNLLATVTLNSTAFGAAVSGVITANQSPALSTNIISGGVAGWMRQYGSGGVTGQALWDGSVGAVSGFDLNLNATTLVSGAALGITSYTFTVPGS